VCGGANHVGGLAILSGISSVSQSESWCMSRSRSSVVSLPWWFGVIVAIVVFILARFGLPALGPASGPAHAVFKVFANMAWAFALPFVFLSIVALVRQQLRSHLLDQQRDLYSIRALHWQEFEQLVGEAFRRQGYRVAERGGAAPDGGVDLVLFKEGKKAVVQCKRWKTKQVGVALVRELYGTMTAEHADEAIFASSGEYTADAQAFANGKPIRLIDGAHLAELIHAVQTNGLVSARAEDAAPVHAAPPDRESQPACPRCGSTMVRRTARSGPTGGQMFWGCSTFPVCRATRPAN
jgi:restriction system protein